ncbi:F420-dependent oxidoreductase [Methanosalsum zhilinae DSM 4017]|uniref:F420-dependent oxidoreductase n=1 Tax=Methanosalsum zhilinae (strain DSM 4017 / NBRC 107636 / OCM 62 / WeN5) TaxID=679901 RepID=F7XMT1_METZD|nr:coenzyme F420-0:L-glutamate ligase [Methanosalsum zhilinae]AEH59948.1 F420-dependent oxidoreductase [Methanosalsum zhilinae DSM 4017]
MNVRSSLQIYGIPTPVIVPGDSIADIIADSLDRAGIILKDRDVLVLAESAVATAEGRIVCLEDVCVSPVAGELAKKYLLDPREMELILQECDEVIGGVPGAVLTITDGTLSPNAGIDSSNAPEGHVVLLPENPVQSASKIRLVLEKRYSCKIGVIIGDSRTQPLRLGCVGIALATSGINPVEDARGACDLYNKPLTITHRAVADNMVSCAQLIMGEAGEGIPGVIIRGFNGDIVDEPIEMPLFSPDECMYYSNISRTGLK